MKLKSNLKYAVIIAALAIALVGCNRQSGEIPEQPSGTPTVESTAPQPETTSPAPEASEVGNVERGAAISLDEAKLIAFEQAGVEEADVEDLEVELKNKRDSQYYEVSFEIENTDYEYEIDAVTGNILKEEID